MAKKSRLAGAPNWVREQAKTAAEVVRPGAALTAAAAAAAGVILESVFDALETRTGKGGRPQPKKKMDGTAPHNIDKPKRKKAAGRKAAASKKKRAAKRSRAPQKAVKKRHAGRST